MLKNQFTNIRKADLNHFILKKRFRPEMWQVMNLLMIITLLILFYALLLVYIYINQILFFWESSIISSITLLFLLRYLIYKFYSQLNFKNLGHFTNNVNCKNGIIEVLIDSYSEINILENENLIFANYDEHFPIFYNVQLFFVLGDDGFLYFNVRRSDKKILFNKSEKIRDLLFVISKKVIKKSN